MIKWLGSTRSEKGTLRSVLMICMIFFASNFVVSLDEISLADAAAKKPLRIGAICNPIDNSARILNSPSPMDIHDSWTGGSAIGTAWSLEVRGMSQDETGIYLKGNLYSPRGGLVNPGVYVLLKEWHCL